MNPNDVHDRESFAAGLNRLRQQQGLAFSRFDVARHGVGRATAHDMCTGKALPGEDALEAFLRVCQVPAEGIAAWLSARRRIAATPEVAEKAAIDADPVLQDVTAQGPAPESFWHWPARVVDFLKMPPRPFVGRLFLLVSSVAVLLYAAIHYLAPLMLHGTTRAAVNRFNLMPMLVGELKPLLLTPVAVSVVLFVCWVAAAESRTTLLAVLAIAGGVSLFVPVTFTVFHAVAAGIVAAYLAGRTRGRRWKITACILPFLFVAAGLSLVGQHWHGDDGGADGFTRAVVGRMLNGLERYNYTRTDGKQISAIYLGSDGDKTTVTYKFPPDTWDLQNGEITKSERCAFHAGWGQESPIVLLSTLLSPDASPKCGDSHWYLQKTASGDTTD